MYTETRRDPRLLQENQHLSRALTFFWTCVSLSCALYFTASANAQNHIDAIDFGVESSESSHSLQADSSETFQGAVDSPARRLLPKRKEGWVGGEMRFKMKVDPKKPNYFTAKFWGSEQTGEESRLMLFVEGEQVGQRHLAEIDPLDILASSARYPDRFMYKTLPLPQRLTQGKREVSLSIRVEGGVWGYGKEFERFQQKLKKPSRGIYRGYTHTDSFLTVGEREEQGTRPRTYPVRTSPGPEVLKETKKRVNKHLRGLIEGKTNDLGEKNIPVLSRACFVPWTVAYHNKAALNKLVRAIDEEYRKYDDDNEIFKSEWHGAGPIGGAISLMGNTVEAYLDHEIEGTGKLRRDAWSEMLLASRNYHISHRRAYSNQAMTVDYGLYRCNRGIALLTPKKAWSEKQALQLLHEGAGIKPWRGSCTPTLGRPEWPSGKNFKQLTDEGLSRELGYVGAYGELVVPIMRDMYEATRPTRGSEGDPELKAQLLKATKARSVFHYPLPDSDGFRSMKIEAVIGWRDWHYPGVVAYGQMPCDDGGPGDAAGTTMDPELIGFTRQMIDDNQFFNEVAVQNRRRGVNVIKALLRIPENYERIMGYRGTLKPLPMTAGQPDFVFADPGVGAIAIKHGDDILYASLYWRARYGINNLARVHFMTPKFAYDSTVMINTGFKSSGMQYEIPNRVNMPFNKRFEDEYKQEGKKFSMAGQVYPIAAMPRFFKDFRPGDENLYAGKGTQYLMVYGRYCVAMNCQSKSTNFDVPEDFVGAEILSESTESIAETKYKLKPNETLVLYREK